MRTCLKCGNELEDSEKFCDKCGTCVSESSDEIIDNAKTIARNRRIGIIITGVVAFIIFLIGIIGAAKHVKMLKKEPYEKLLDSYVDILNYNGDMQSFYDLYAVDAVKEYYNVFDNIIVRSSDSSELYDEIMQSKMDASGKHFDEAWNNSRIVASEILSTDAMTKEEICIWQEWLEDEKERIENSFSYYSDVYKQFGIKGEVKEECTTQMESSQSKLMDDLAPMKVSEGYVLYVKFYNTDNPNECERAVVNVLKIGDEYVFASKDKGMAELLISSTINIY